MNPRDTGSALPEWGELEFSHPVRQGDVLVPLHDVSDPWHQVLVVLTANCDLARAKHGGALTCIPVLHHEEYLLRFVVDRLQDALCERLVSLLMETHQAAVDQGPAIPKISAGRMGAWVGEEDIAVVLKSLGITGEQADRFTELAATLSSLTTETERSLSEVRRALAHAKLTTRDVRNAEKATSWVSGELVSSIKKLPGDALFLNEVSPDHRDGYVAYLRRVIEVNEEAVVTTTFRLPADADYLRVSRLRSPYVFAMSQQFGAIFSAVGLPAEYEQARESLIDHLRQGT